MKKLISILLILIIIIGVLSSCSSSGNSIFDNLSSLSEDEIYGTYKGTYEYNGNTFDVTIRLNSDDTYKKLTIKNGKTHSDEKGTCKYEDNTVKLYKDGFEGEWITYNIKNNTLENNSHYFKKTSK